MTAPDTNILDAIVQAAIGLTGAGAVWLTASGDRKGRVVGYGLGLLGQPFWFITSFMYGQWGIFLLSGVYTIAWSRGFLKAWRAWKAAQFLCNEEVDERFEKNNLSDSGTLDKPLINSHSRTVAGVNENRAASGRND